MDFVCDKKNYNNTYYFLTTMFIAVIIFCFFIKSDLLMPEAISTVRENLDPATG